MFHLNPDEFRALAVCGMFAFVAFGCVVIALLDHQRKMAGILRADKKETDGLDARVDALQGEIRELKSMLAAQNSRQPDENLSQRIR